MELLCFPLTSMFILVWRVVTENAVALPFLAGGLVNLVLSFAPGGMENIILTESVYIAVAAMAAYIPISHTERPMEGPGTRGSR